MLDRVNQIVSLAKSEFKIFFHVGGVLLSFFFIGKGSLQASSPFQVAREAICKGLCE